MLKSQSNHPPPPNPPFGEMFAHLINLHFFYQTQFRHFYQIVSQSALWSAHLSRQGLRRDGMLWHECEDTFHHGCAGHAIALQTLPYPHRLDSTIPNRSRLLIEYLQAALLEPIPSAVAFAVAPSGCCRKYSMMLSCRWLIPKSSSLCR